MTFVEIHIVQTLPPSCLNRDDTGSPKTAFFGGVERARVSSQAWKRACRRYFAEHLPAEALGTRTLELPGLIADRVQQERPDLPRAEALRAAVEVLGAAGLKAKEPKAKKGEEQGEPLLGALAFASSGQIAALARHALAALEDPAYLASSKKAVKAAADTQHSLDIALFGRMVADDKDLNVDAACQVAHAIGVHRNQTEYDFYTALDDAKAARADSDAGGAMMGTIEFSSATLYRYAVVDVDDLAGSLESREEARAGVRSFVEAFVRSLPTGRQNSFAAHSLPAAVLVTVRDTQPMSLAGAFEKAITGPGLEEQAVAALLAKKERVERMYADVPRAEFLVTESEGSLTELLDGLEGALLGGVA